MIFECKAYGPDGKLKSVKSPEECTAHFYRNVEGIKFDNLKPKARGERQKRALKLEITGVVNG